jgi:hypothetical protein
MVAAVRTWAVVEYVISAWVLCLLAYVVYLWLFGGRRH